MSKEPRCWKVSPEDHSRGRGGFNGEYFDVTGVTDVEFATEADAIAVIKARRPKWMMSRPENMSGAVFQAPGRKKYLHIFPCY